MIESFYSPGSSLLHRMDPRPKLMILAAWMFLFFPGVDLELLSAYLGFVLILFLLVLGWRNLGVVLVSILPLIFLILLLTPPFTITGRVLFEYRGLILLTDAGLKEALRLAVRFALFTLLAVLFFRTTSPEELVLSLVRMGLPFSWALVATLTLRMIPSMIRLYRNVHEAHLLRRADGQAHSRRFLRRLRELLPELTTVTIQAIRTIPDLAMALEIRGLGRRNKRSSYLVLKRGLPLFLELILSFIFIILMIAPLGLFPLMRR